MMHTLIFATHNPGKAREVQQLLPGGFAVKSLQDIGYTKEIDETGKTLQENALIKARQVFRDTGENCFAEDTGLEVEALGGAPGVYSSRYAGEEGDAQKNMNLLLQNLSGGTDRKARFRTVMALILDGKEYIFEGEVKGSILHKQQGGGGFGYDPVFQPDGYNTSFAEMTPSEKNAISHRGRALMKMIEFLRAV